MNILNRLMGRGVCKVDVMGNANVPGMAVVYIHVPKNWLRKKVYAVDMVTFLLFTEKLVEHTDYSKDFVYHLTSDVMDIKGHRSSKQVQIEHFAVRAAQQACGALGPQVYEMIKAYDKAVDKFTEAFLASPDYTEEAKKKIRERESLMSVYKREHAKMRGIDPMVYVSGNDTVN